MNWTERQEQEIAECLAKPGGEAIKALLAKMAELLVLISNQISDMD